MVKAELQPAPDTLERDTALFMAKAAEQAERYEEMVQYMKRIINLTASGDEMAGGSGEDGLQYSRGVEERNLISVGYKNMMSVRRTAVRTVDQNLEKDCKIPDKVAEYKNLIAEEVFSLIKEVIEDVVKVFVEGPKKASDPEVLVFFRKMEGDYNRYGAEISTGAVRDGFKNDALAAYAEAEKLANEHLPSTNPIRLGLALNFSVFYYEICDEKNKASELAKQAFDKAIDHLDTLSEEAYKDSTLIMQLLKDNLTLWLESKESDDEDINGLQVEEVDDQ